MAQGRVYTIAQHRSISAACDIWTLTPGDNHPIRLLGMRLATPSIVKDANEVSQAFYLRAAHGTLTAGSGGAAITPRPVVVAGQAASCTAREGDTTNASGSSYTYHLYDSWNLRGGYELWLPEKAQIIVRETNSLSMVLNGAPTTAAWDWTVWFEEL